MNTLLHQIETFAVSPAELDRRTALLPRLKLRLTCTRRNPIFPRSNENGIHRGLLISSGGSEDRSGKSRVDREHLSSHAAGKLVRPRSDGDQARRI